MKIFYLPDLGEGLAEAEIREWYVKVGDEVKVDQPLVAMETAKALVDVPSPYAGKIVELHGNANDVIKTHAPLITFETADEVPDKPKGSVVGSLEESSSKWRDEEVIVGKAETATSTIKAMPAARVLAKQLHVNLNDVTGTGPKGLITPDDVKKYLAQHSHPTVSHLNAAEALHGVRRAMAQAMAQSHQEIVPVTVFDDVDISDWPEKLDITVHLIKAIIAAVKEEPALNAWFDGKNLQRQLVKEVNLGLAVDTSEGLFVPVIKDAQSLSEQELREKVNYFKSAVQSRSVLPKDLQGATITLSNFGMIAGRYATPIIVPPTVAIIGCGRSRETVLSRNGQIQAGRIMPLSLTFDHRAVTGGEATRFLGVLIKYLEKG